MPLLRLRTLALFTFAFSMLHLPLSTGCGGVQRRQDRAVDAELRGKAPRWKRKGRRPVQLGPWELARVDARAEPYDQGGAAFTIRGAGREVSQYRSVVTLRHSTDGHERVGECKSRFTRAGLAELDGVVPSQTTQISVRCRVVGDDGRSWRFSSSGRAGRDISGRFALEQIDGQVDRSLYVDLDLYNDLNGPRYRPIAHLHSDDGVVAGALFTFPERVWLDPQLDPQTSEAALALLMSLRYLEFEPPKKAKSRSSDDEDDDRKGPLERILSGLAR